MLCFVRIDLLHEFFVSSSALCDGNYDGFSHSFLFFFFQMSLQTTSSTLNFFRKTSLNQIDLEYSRMDRFPYEILYCIATHLDSPKDLCSFSAVFSTFYPVSRDERLWRQFCHRLYRILPPAGPMTMSYYE